MVAGVVVAEDVVATPGIGVTEGLVPVRRGDGHTFEGTLLGRSAGTGLTFIRVPGLGAPSASPGDDPRPGHLALAVGRTLSGNVFSLLAPVAVVGGPLRTGRSTEIPRVVRIGLLPHPALAGGALVDGSGRVLGVITSMDIRSTTVTVPSSLAWEAVREVVSRGPARRGYIGVSSVPVTLSPRQRADGRDRGLLVTGVADGAPAEAAGVLVGDVIVSFDGQPVIDAETLATSVRSARLDGPTPLGVLRGATVEALSVAVAERPAG